MQIALEVNNRVGRAALNFKFNFSRLSPVTRFLILGARTSDKLVFEFMSQA